MLLTNRWGPGTSIKPNRRPCSSSNAKPKRFATPPGFSSPRSAGCVPVSAWTSADLPWSICPAVPTITLFAGVDMGSLEFARAVPPLGMLLEERIGGQTEETTSPRQSLPQLPAPPLADPLLQEWGVPPRENPRPRESLPQASPCAFDRLPWNSLFSLSIARPASQSRIPVRRLCEFPALPAPKPPRHLHPPFSPPPPASRRASSVVPRFPLRASLCGPCSSESSPPAIAAGLTPWARPH